MVISKKSSTFAADFETDIYNQYKSGLQMYQAGWSLMGIGLAVDAAFLTYSAVGIYYWAKTYDPERPTMGLRGYQTHEK